jgi:hypothetical protein
MPDTNNPVVELSDQVMDANFPEEFVDNLPIEFVANPPEEDIEDDEEDEEQVVEKLLFFVTLVPDK